MDIPTKNHVEYQKEVLRWIVSASVWKLEKRFAKIPTLARWHPKKLRDEPQRPPPFIVWDDKFEYAASMSSSGSEEANSTYETLGEESQHGDFERVASGKQDDNRGSQDDHEKQFGSEKVTAV
jgi:hypothetical protein